MLLQVLKCRSFNSSFLRAGLSTVANVKVDKVFNDCVHGHIRLHPLCVKIIDTPEFQRLRNIKQLGLTYYVYPGACHNRFEHSLGVCYLSGRMVEALKKNTKGLEINEVEKLCVEIAGLCHDLGHGPFSHTWEQILAACGKKWKHEKASVSMFDSLIEANGLSKDFNDCGIGVNERDLIKEFINGSGSTLPVEKRFLYQIVSNKEDEIDVDKWDYLLRDSRQLNIKITFDYQRLLEFCSVVKRESKYVIAYRNKEYHNLFDMFRVRADLHWRAYQHQVVKNIDLMLIDAFKMADPVYTVGDSEIRLSEAHEKMEVFSSLTDHVFYTIYYDKNPALDPAREIFKRILTRKLYTLIGRFELVTILEGHTHIDHKDKFEKLKKKTVERLKQCKGHEDLRSCFITLDFGKHENPLAKVVLFDKFTMQPTTATRSFPLQLSGPTLELCVFHTLADLEPKTKEDLKNELERVLGDLLKR